MGRVQLKPSAAQKIQTPKPRMQGRVSSFLYWCGFQSLAASSFQNSWYSHVEVEETAKMHLQERSSLLKTAAILISTPTGCP